MSDTFDENAPPSIGDIDPPREPYAVLTLGALPVIIELDPRGHWFGDGSRARQNSSRDGGRR